MSQSNLLNLARNFKMRFFSWRGVVSSLFGFLSFSWLWSTVRMVEHYSNCENGHPEVEHSVRNPKAFQQAPNSVFHDFENRLHIWVKIRRLCWIIISVQAKTCPTCSVFIQKQLSISWAMGRINQVGQPEENPWKFCKILRVWQFRAGLSATAVWKRLFIFHYLLGFFFVRATF